MLHRVATIKGCRIVATDGHIGKVDDVYFDDMRWALRYLVVDTGTWLSGRKVLISPHAVTRVDPAALMVVLNISRTMVQHSPSIDTDKPVSRQREAEYYRYYRYPIYWSTPTLWGTGAVPFILPPHTGPYADIAAQALSAELESHSSGDSHLRSANEVIGYRVLATDHSVGHVEDLLVDAESWAINYLMVDTGNWLPGEHVLVAPRWMQAVDWVDKAVSVAQTREDIRQGLGGDPPQ